MNPIDKKAMTASEEILKRANQKAFNKIRPKAEEAVFKFLGEENYELAEDLRNKLIVSHIENSLDYYKDLVQNLSDELIQAVRDRELWKSTATKHQIDEQ